MGIFLAPNGAMSMNHSRLDGRFFGGDVQNQQIVSGADINAPVPVLEPSSFALFGVGSLFVGICSGRRRAKSV